VGVPLPLPTMLSAALVAFTIEFDNEAEHRLPHRTATYGPSDPAQPRAPWLVSQAMWANVLQYVEPGGTTVSELRARSHVRVLQLPGLTRWGYVTASEDEDPLVRPTRAGRAYLEMWRPLAGEIERRWTARFGALAISDLRSALTTVVDGTPVELPAYLPITAPTQNGKVERPEPRQAGSSSRKDQDVSVLLARALLRFTLDVESESRLALPICADTLRVLDQDGVLIRDLPLRSGVSKQAQAMSVGFLARRECVVVEPAPGGGRGRAVRLTEKGAAARAKYLRILRDTEAAWHSTIGAPTVDGLRLALDRLVGAEPTRAASPLFAGLTPCPGARHPPASPDGAPPRRLSGRCLIRPLARRCGPGCRGWLAARPRG
jgi:DNA-binding MarR family transcriptional regulator